MRSIPVELPIQSGAQQEQARVTQEAFYGVSTDRLTQEEKRHYFPPPSPPHPIWGGEGRGEENNSVNMQHAFKVFDVLA